MGFVLYIFRVSNPVFFCLDPEKTNSKNEIGITWDFLYIFRPLDPEFFSWIRIRYRKIMYPDPVCPERLDPDPI